MMKGDLLVSQSGGQSQEISKGTLNLKYENNLQIFVIMRDMDVLIVQGII